MAQLTDREREVVKLLAQGKQQKEIAAMLCVSRRTIKAHSRNARDKAGCKTVAELTYLLAVESKG